MKRVFFTLAAAIMLFLLSGCAEADLACGVEADHTAFLRFTLEVDLEAVPKEYHDTVRGGLQSLKSGFSRLGFARTHDNFAEKPQKLRILAEKSQQAENDKDAFEKLREMLTDESLSPFSTLRAEQYAGSAVSTFVLSGTLDAQKLLATANVADFPEPLAGEFARWIAQSRAQISVTLPATETVGHSGDVGQKNTQATGVTQVSLTESTSVLLSTQAAYDYSYDKVLTADEFAAARRQLDEQQKFLVGAGIGAAGLFLLCLIWLVLRLRARRRGDECA